MDVLSSVSACTLPTAEQPLREFDAFCATTVQSLERVGPLSIRLRLLPTPDVAATAAGLLVRETACCSFFSFSLAATAGELVLDVTVPARYESVLEALSVRAARSSA